MFLFALAMMVAMALPTFAAEPRALLDVPTKTKVHITSRNYSSAYLNVENKASIVQSGDTVGVWSNTGDDSQRWYIETIDAGNRLYRVGCYNHTDLTLNIYRPSDANAACTVYPGNIHLIFNGSGAKQSIPVVSSGCRPVGRHHNQICFL